MDVPTRLLEGLRPPEQSSVRAWWATLSDVNQTEISALLDPRCEDCFFGLVDEDDDPGARVVGRRFLPKEDTTGWEEWRAELFDYLMCHPELAEPLVVRIFHIGCVRHMRTERYEAMENGVDFHCPVGSKRCPVRRLLTLSMRQPLQQTAVE